ncbi:MAG: hypothetical protein LBD21_03570 [Tannerellaceae bacterium]|jgi:hypothetical protein|nr:hypothetical protein [Tannerellaceae bacterium]
MVQGQSLPDNVIDPYCAGTAPGISSWGLQTLSQSSSNRVASHVQPLVGDLTGDGVPEIVAWSLDGGAENLDGGSSTISPRVRTMLIYDGRDVTTPVLSVPLSGDVSAGGIYVQAFGAVPYGLVKVGAARLIVVACSDYKLRAYDIVNGDPAQQYCVWTSTAPFSDVSGDTHDKRRDLDVNIGFADFNHDGTPEIYVRNKIFNAATGALLATASGGTNTASSYAYISDANYIYSGSMLSAPIAANVVGNSSSPLELILGNQVYDVNIVPSGTSTITRNSSASVTPPTGAVADGHTQVADFDGDGELEVLVTKRDQTTSGNTYMYIYKPSTGARGALRTIPMNLVGKAIPLIADIDGDGNLEIVLELGATAYRISIYECAVGGLDLTLESMSTFTLAGEDVVSVAPTAFNLDQSGPMEVLFLTLSGLRIFDGSTKELLLSFGSCHTVMQFPIVADVNADGSADIVFISGGINDGRMTVLNASTESGRWAPARKVWNQGMYHSVNVNNDLSIPQTMFGPAGTLGSLRPFNNFFQQQTLLNVSGVPLWPLPDLRHVPGSASFSYNAYLDVMTLNFRVSNAGEAYSLPLSVTAYKDAVGNSIKYTDTHAAAVIRPDSTAAITMRIPNYRSQWGSANIAVRLNDAGSGSDAQDACNHPDRDIILDAPFIVNDDWVGIPYYKSSVEIDVLANDFTSCPSVGVGAVVMDIASGGSPKHGVAVRNGLKITYTPTAGYIGRDTIVYDVTCGGLTKSGKVYIICEFLTDNIHYPFCSDEALPTTWSIKVDKTTEGETVAHNISPLVGDLDGDGFPEIVVFGLEGASALDGTQGYLAELRVRTILVYDGRDLSNVKATIKLSNGTGTSDTGPGNELYMSAFQMNPFGLVRTPSGQGLIVVACSDYRLHAYTLASSDAINPAIPLWISEPYTDRTDLNSLARLDANLHPGFADFNHDGYPEVYARNRIYDAESGALLLIVGDGTYTGSTYGAISHMGSDPALRKLSSPVAANVWGDEQSNLELILGNRIYGIEIDRNNVGNAALNYATELRTFMSPNFSPGADGHPQVADFNHDGHLDILISVRKSPALYANVYMYIHDVYNNVTGPAVEISTDYPGKSFPLITDLNNNGKLDVLIQCFGIYMLGNGGTGYRSTDNNQFLLFEVDPSALHFTYTWGFQPDEDSYSNTASAFDFNLDGSLELLLTDQSAVRIFDGITKAELTPSFAFSQVTQSQVPVVADVDGDGAAEIVACGNWKLQILKSNGTPWAPARKVWNQYMYNSVNINEDLTVPSHQLNSAYEFSGPPATQPFNNFFQQQTYLNMQGKPYWRLPNAAISGVDYEYYGLGDSIALDISIANIGETQLRSPIRVDVYTKKGGVETLKENQTITSPLEAGSSIMQHIKLTGIAALDLAATDSIIVYVNRNSSTLAWEQQECDYTTNRFGVSLRKLRDSGLDDDTQTVQKFFSTEINVLGNDLFPSGWIAGLPAFSLIDSVILQPRNGKLVGTGSGAASKIIYVNEGTDSLTVNPIDSFVYRIRMPDGRTPLPATVYIYILEDLNGATACTGQAYTAKLKALPSGTTFDWFASLPDAVLALNTVTYTTGVLLGNWSCFVQPKNVGEAALPWNAAGGFPFGSFTIHASPAGEQMRWTGHISSDWNNPANWVVVRSVGESPATFLPGLCTDVTISSSVDNFPELGTDTARCHNIRMLDRAMLKNPHVLKYTAASVELKMKPAEMNRFVMWSAPLQQMYSGDYHFRKGSTLVGDAFMNFFQINNPDPSHGTAVPNRFTATFANPNVALPLGRAFNLKVMSTSVTRDSLLRFPRSETGYTDPAGGPVLSLDRTNSGRFITDSHQTPDPYDMPVSGGIIGSTLVQVVNPYMAYLDMNAFFGNFSNTTAIQTGYYIWDGEVGNDVQVHAFATTNGGNQNNRIVANIGIPRVATPRYIAPLQSFFVAKRNVNSTLGTLKMSRAWTTTKPVDSYTLRAGVQSGGVLNVTLSGADKQASAALVYEPGTSNFERDHIDMPAVTYTIDDEKPLSLYTFSADLSPLVINASSTLDMLPVSLGIIAEEPGEYSLSFEGLHSFGHEVSLMDMALNKRVDITSASDSYTFTLIKPHGSGSIEVNDRFKLYLKYTGSGIGFGPTATEDVKSSLLKVTSGPGYINVSVSETVSSLDVFDASGRSVYRSSKLSGTVRIPVAGGLYILKAMLGSETQVEKISVK